MSAEAAAVVVSVLAFGFSILSTIISVRQQRVTTDREVRDQVSSLMKDIIQTLTESRRLQSVPAADRTTEHIGHMGVVTQQLSLLARQVDFLFNELEHARVHDVEYATVAQAFAVVGDNRQADLYWQKAIAAAGSSYYAAVNQRGYADYLFAQSRVDEGRARYQEALETVRRAEFDRDFVHWTNAYTCQMWVFNELMTGDRQRAKEVDALARQEYGALSRAWLRDQGLQALDALWKGHAAWGSGIVPTPTAQIQPTELTGRDHAGDSGAATP